MANINRDYLVILDVKSGELSGSTQMYFYNTDKNTSNIYVQLVIKETTVDATPIENATNYIVESKIVKPGPVFKDLTGVLVNEAEAIYEFDLPNDCTNLSGSYKIEFWVKAKVEDKDELVTSSKAKYKVKKSILTDLDEAIEDSTDYPLLLQLMEEVRVINATAQELDTQIRTLQADMIDANEEMKRNEEQRQANEVLRETNEATRITQENARQEYLNAFDAKWEEYKTNTTNDITDYKESINTDISDFKSTTSNDIANYKSQIDAQEVIRETNEEQRKANEQRRIANEDERKVAENQRKANEFERRTNEAERKSAEASRVSAENARATNEEVRQTNDANREAAEEIRKANEEARITAETARVTEHEQMRTELNEVKAENAILMENDKKVADRMTQVEISDKRQYVIMEGLMNSAGDGYLKIEDTGNDTTLYNSIEGFVDVKNITGNTMVNSIKNPDDEFTLNADINTSGQSVTLTTAVDNGQVDVLAEGNTMVNVCDQQEAVAITKSYTVENASNHIPLQGEFDGKARPVVTGNTLVNIVKSVSSTEVIKGNSVNILLNHVLLQDKDYTIKFTIESKIGSQPLKFRQYNVDGGTVYNNNLDFNKDPGTYMVKMTPTTELGRLNLYYDSSASEEEYSCIITNIILLEGDYTNKPLPDYFTGIQSSFEDKVVTQEMVDSGKELAENLGKYRVDYKVTGKNKANDNNGYTMVSWSGEHINHKVCDLDLIVGKTYTLLSTANPEVTSENGYRVNVIGVKNSTDTTLFQIIGNSPQVNTFTLYTEYDSYYISAYDFNNSGSVVKIQLEEGTQATAYEPYKEHIKTYYLNRPLLEGDTIEESNGNVYHVHRYGKVVLDGDNNWNSFNNTKTNNFSVQVNINHNFATGSSGNTASHFSNYYLNKYSYQQNDSTHFYCERNIISFYLPKAFASNLNELKSKFNSVPLELIFKLASPRYELISQSDTILTDSYVAGHLDFDTAVPVEKVKFNDIGFGLKYTYPSTEYIVQFESDNIGVLNRVYLGGSITTSSINVVKGINKINITTPSSSDKLIILNGIGFNVSNIVVTEATDKDFGYFSGMKSVGELEENKIEILSSNKNLFDINVFNDRNNFKLCRKGDSWYYYPIFIGIGNKAYLKRKYKDNVTNYSMCLLCNDAHEGMNKTWLPMSHPSYTGMNYSGDIIADSNGYVYILITISNINNYKNILDEVIISITNSDYISHASNKKQILLNEPLRAVGDTKDRFVQIDGKWYVERNVGEVVLDGSETTWGKKGYGGHETRNTFECIFKYLGTPNLSVPAISDRYSCELVGGIPVNDNAFRAYTTVNSPNNIPYTYFLFTPSTSLIPYQNLDAWKTYLSNNPVTIIYQLASPTYEPVEISPTLNTYSEVTHITNNSTIPMNMPIVNSGYEIIAKPSTKYTVVGITNGRIGDSTIVNGTITTPETLDDPFLRPYGTGKTSKVMLLEGEPANIPGYFKGIKSVFEDKVTEDGKYAVEVKVVGKNKFDVSKSKIVYPQTSSDFGGGNGDKSLLPIIKLKPNTSYICKFHGQSISTSTSFTLNAFICSNDKYPKNIVSVNSLFNNKKLLDYIDVNKQAGKDYFTFTTDNIHTNLFWGFNLTSQDIVIEGIQIEEGTVATEYEPYHETKQTLYLDEPLYNTNNITIYNDKLGYWKNWDKVVLNGSENWKLWSTTTPTLKRFAIENFGLVEGSCLSDIFKEDKKQSGTANIGEGICLNGALTLCILKSKLSTQDIVGLKQYLSQNPVTVVYQLAEPVFVPLIDNCPNWVIGSWDNCSIHFDSIIPLAATRYRYTGNVPSVVTMSDDVAETKSISDEQDAMIVDLATDVAVMEMMLM